MTESFDLKVLLARIALGERIESRRVMPFPHRFYLIAPNGGEVEVSEEWARYLVDAKLIAGKPQDALWDHIAYPATPALPDAALAAWRSGYGRCACCGVVLGPMPNGSAPRHGHTRGPNGLPPCDGSLKPLVGLRRRAKPDEAAA